MIVFAIFIVLEIESKKDILNILKVFSASTIFAILWGIAQFCMFYLNMH